MPKPISKIAKIKKEDKNDEFVWLVAYIDSKYLDKVERQLHTYPEYIEVEAYIPTVKILKKTFKKENYFEEVPLLFNYGFFKVPRRYAIFKDWLDNMQKNISCIYAWVRDPANVIKSQKPILREDNNTLKANRGNISVAVANSQEISDLIRDSINIGAHSSEDIHLLSPGNEIILRGYPFEGMKAIVVEVDMKKEKVKVELTLFNQMREQLVSFDNVFFTIYHNNQYNDVVDGKNSIDAMDENRFEKIQKKRHEKDSE